MGLRAEIGTQSPTPDWLTEKPERSNRTFYYYVEKAVGETETQARNLAYTQAFMQVALKLGIPLNTEDVSEAIANGGNLKMLSQRFTIPINVVCFYSQKKDGMWNYWLLCQIPETGYANTVRFDDFNECYKHDIYDAQKAQKESAIRDQVQQSNAAAIAMSAFIPGSGQMYKGHYTEGVFTMIGDLGLIGGGVACHFMANKQRDIAKAWNVDYDTYSAANKQEKNLRIAEYSLFGAAGALYIFNLCRAYLAPNKKLMSKLNADLYPTMIPVNGTQNPAMAIQINF